MLNWKKVEVSKDLDTLRRESLKENEVSEIKSVDTWKLWKTKKNWNKYTEDVNPRKPEDFSSFLEGLDFVKDEEYKDIDKFEDDLSAYEDWLDNDCYGNDTSTPEAKHAINGSIADLGAQEHLIDDSDLDRYVKDDLHKRLNDVVDRLLDLLKESAAESEPTGVKKQDFNLKDNNTGVEKTSIDSKKDPFKESLLDDFNDDPIALRNYLLNKEEAADLDKEERYTLQNLIQEYGYPDEDESEEVDFDEVYDAAIDALDWYLYEHKNCKCTDEQKEEAAKNMAQTIVDDGEWDPDNPYIFDGMIEGVLKYLGVKLNESKITEADKGSQEYCIKLTIHTVHGFQDLYTCFDLYRNLHYSSFKERAENLPSLDDRKTAEGLLHIISKDYFDKYQDRPIIRIVKASRETLEESKMRESSDKYVVICTLDKYKSQYLTADEDEPSGFGLTSDFNKAHQFNNKSEAKGWLNVFIKGNFWDENQDIVEPFVNEFDLDPEDEDYLEIPMQYAADVWFKIVGLKPKYELDESKMREAKPGMENLTKAGNALSAAEENLMDVRDRQIDAYFDTKNIKARNYIQVAGNALADAEEDLTVARDAEVDAMCAIKADDSFIYDKKYDESKLKEALHDFDTVRSILGDETLLETTWAYLSSDEQNDYLETICRNWDIEPAVTDITELLVNYGASPESIIQELSKEIPTDDWNDIISWTIKNYDLDDEEFEDFYESRLKESKEFDITIDFPITVSSKGRIKANDAKKLLKYLAQNKMLRLGRTWYVKDSTGRETCWTLMKGYFDEYVFSCEITDSIEDEEGNYDELDWYNGLSFSKSNGKLTDFEWESYKVN